MHPYRTATASPSDLRAYMSRGTPRKILVQVQLYLLEDTVQVAVAICVEARTLQFFGETSMEELPDRTIDVKILREPRVSLQGHLFITAPTFSGGFVIMLARHEKRSKVLSFDKIVAMTLKHYEWKRDSRKRRFYSKTKP